MIQCNIRPRKSFNLEGKHMRTIRSLLFALTIGLMSISIVGASSPMTVNLPGSETAVQYDDTVPEVTVRVARISFISGDVQIRRTDSQEWERATLNLPIVEGDELTTSGDSRFEIQFDRSTHLRVSYNSYVKISRLNYDGVALSLPQGLASLRVRDFDKDKAYFEIDAPGSTVAVQREGMYRIDAGQPGDSEIRLAVTEGGEARIYSETSGFLLKNGRSAKVYIAGNTVGEWETGDASRFADEFDTWAIERDSVISRSLRNAHYDSYYDQDIYGAEDLGDYGEWVYTRKYGYVWRPYRSSISSYANWSPYRYGHWRWIAPYGWTWVNDEPWGWATYHHGRWIYDDGGWVWTPYGMYRSMRSWWSPGMVVFSLYNGNICWYPLPYTYAFYNYNYYYYNGGWGGHGGGPHPTPTPRSTPNPVVTPTPAIVGPPPKGPKMPPLGQVPPTAVVSVSADQFGRTRKGNMTPPLSVATTILSTTPDDGRNGPKLPSIKEIKGPISNDIRSEKPRVVTDKAPVRTGAVIRTTDKPLDNDLRTTRIFGGRPPLTTKNDTPPANTGAPIVRTPRDTGAVDRQPPVKQSPPAVSPPVDRVKQPPVYVPPTRTETPRSDPPTSRQEPPRYTPPPRQDTPRYTPPPRQDTPRNDPPPTRQPPRSDPPPTKSEPKPDKPAPVENKGSRKPDNR